MNQMKQTDQDQCVFPEEQRMPIYRNKVSPITP